MKALLSIALVMYSAQFLLAPNKALAHPGNTDGAGCHTCRTNCPSWGYSYGEYHCHGGYGEPEPVYICPEATVGNGRWTLKEANACNQDIVFDWDEGDNDDFYSVGISKTAGADPGPKSDTRETSYTFKDIKPGVWYVNIKPGRSCGWGDIYYWKIDVPKVKPTVYFSEEIVSESERKLYYGVSCAEKAEIDQKIGKLKSFNGSVTIHPKEDALYTLTASNGKESVSSSVAIQYPLPKKDEKKVAVVPAVSTAREDKDANEEPGYAWFWILVGGGGVWLARKVINNKEEWLG